MGPKRKAVAKKDEAIDESNSENKEIEGATNIANKPKRRAVAKKDEATNESNSENKEIEGVTNIANTNKVTEVKGSLKSEEEKSSRKNLPANEDTGNRRSPEKLPENAVTENSSKKTTSKSKEEKSISLSSNKEKAIGSPSCAAASGAAFSESFDEEMSAINIVIYDTLCLDANETEQVTLKKRKRGSEDNQSNVLPSENSEGEEDVGAATDKKESVRASKRANTSPKKHDVAVTESDDREVCGESEDKKVKDSTKSKKEPVRASKKGSTKTQDVSESDEEEVSDESSTKPKDKVKDSTKSKKEPVRASKKGSTKTQDVSESDEEEVSDESPQKPKDKVKDFTKSKKEPVRSSKRGSTKTQDVSESDDEEVSDESAEDMSNEKENESSSSSSESSAEGEIEKQTKKPKKEYPCFSCKVVFNETKHLFDHTCKGKKNKGFMCRVCKKVYERRSTYVNHQVIHAKVNKRPYKCGLCRTSSVSQSNHIAHMNREHPERKPFVCTISTCEIDFESNKELMSHLMRIHNINKCKYCDEKFPTELKLNRHKYNEHEKFFKIK